MNNFKINPFKRTFNKIPLPSYNATNNRYYQFDGNFNNNNVNNNIILIQTNKTINEIKEKYSYDYENLMIRLQYYKDDLVTGHLKKDYINYDGNYKNNTDYQICSFADINRPEKIVFLINAYNILGDKCFIKNNTFNQMYVDIIKILGKDSSNLTEMELIQLNYAEDVLKQMINNGYGDYTMYQAAHLENGLDYFIMKDKSGNYILNFPCTEEEVGKDWMSDGGNLLLGTFGSQTDSAKYIARNIYLLAQKEGVSLTITGYSLGGGIAESAYLELIKEFGTDNETIGYLSVYEPFHYSMDENETQLIKKMYKEDKIRMFAAKGSFVSSITTNDALVETTKYIDVNYVEQYSDAGLNISKYVWGGAHDSYLPNLYRNENFDEHGQYKRIQNINEDYLKPEEICKNLNVFELKKDILSIVAKLLSEVTAITSGRKEIDINKFTETIITGPMYK